MKVLLFGGSFDPIHKGHIEILQKAQNFIKADKVFLIPSGYSSYKELNETNQNRLKLTSIVAKKYGWAVSDYDVINNNAHTINLINYCKQFYINDELYFLIGSDQLEVFNSWYEYEEILKKVKLIVYPRKKNTDLELIKKYNAILLQEKVIDISASLFRQTFNLELLDSDVASFIINNGLYYKYFLNKYMDEERYLHSMRVAKTAKRIMVANNMSANDINEAWIAGLYHDIAKCFSKEMLEYLGYEVIKLDYSEPWKTLHGPVGAYWLKNQYNFKNNKILNAIVRHTKPFNFGSNLTILDKVLYCADKLEPLRTNADINNIEYFRNLMNCNIDECFNQLYVATQNQYKN